MGQVKLVFLPLWLAGHQISLLQTANLLLNATDNEKSDISITVLLIKPPNSHGHSLPTHLFVPSPSSRMDINYQELPEVEPPQDTQGMVDFVSLFLQSNAPHVRAALASSTIPVTALVIDFFATSVMDVANELRIPTYVYFTSTALMLSLLLYLPTLDEKIPIDFEEVQEPIDIDGVSCIPPLSMPSPLMKKNQRYKWLVYHGRRFQEARGIIVNTFAEVEPAPIGAISEGRFMHGHRLPPVYPVGPILSLGGGDAGRAGADRHECVKWLDGQPRASVVFLCFGSMGTFDTRQVREIASGLEQSGHRFLWSLRITPASSTDANTLEDVLPEGFLERTRDTGMVWPSWVPQVEILSHGAVGGFVTHCGWNSCLESMWFGVPMLAWPLYAEQHLNEVELVRDLGVAVGLKMDRKGGNYVAADELERGVRCLMGESEGGRKVREKVGEMSLASRNALREGGSSCTNLRKLAKELFG